MANVKIALQAGSSTNRQFSKETECGLVFYLCSSQGMVTFQKLSVSVPWGPSDHETGTHRVSPLWAAWFRETPGDHKAEVYLLALAKP